MEVDEKKFKGKSRQLASWTQLESSRPLPVRFQLFASKRMSRALCPCLVITHRNISVIRILDPEHRQPYISLDSIFLLADRSIPQGILEFDLSREAGDYDLTLAGLEPREALWAPLRSARRIAEEVGLLEPLAVLLDWENRHIWSLDDEGEGGLVHNWRALQLDAASYSTTLLVQDELKSVSLLPKGQQIRTLISQEQRQEALERAVTITTQNGSQQSSTYRSKYEQRLLRWSVLACEELQRSQKDLDNRIDERGSRIEGEHDEEEQFDIKSNEMLLLFDDYLSSLQVDTTIESVLLNPEEIITGKSLVSRKKEARPASVDDVYRMARIHVTLIHHLWTLCATLTVAKSTSVSTKEVPSLAVEKEEQTGMKEQLNRLEELSTRAEWGLSELLSRKSSSSQLTTSQQEGTVQAKWLCRIPGVGIIDSRLFIALIIGILLGNMTNRM